MTTDVRTCLTCHRRYSATVRFCPHDGVALVAARAASPSPNTSQVWLLAAATCAAGVLLISLAALAFGSGEARPVEPVLSSPMADERTAPIEVHADPQDVRRHVEAFFSDYRRTSRASDAEWQRVAVAAAQVARNGNRRDHARAWFARARVDQNAGRLAEAARGYQLAREHNLEWGFPPNALGILAAHRGEYAEAARHYARAAELEPEWLFPHLNLAGALAQSGQIMEAEAPARAVLRVQPARASVRWLLAKSLAAKGHPADAAREARRALKDAPSGWLGATPEAVRAAIAKWDPALPRPATPSPEEADPEQPEPYVPVPLRTSTERGETPPSRPT